MMTEAQHTKIHNYLLSKKLPVDILLEVQDHFVSQINEIMQEKNFDFETAFESVKISWKPEFEIIVPFYILFNKDKVSTTRFELHLRKESDLSYLKKSAFIAVSVMMLIYTSTYFLGRKEYETFVAVCMYIVCAFGYATIFYNYIVNRFAYNKKYNDIRFSIYHWRNFFIFSFGYFGIQYVKPLSSWVLKAVAFQFSMDAVLKMTVFLVIIIGFIFTGLTQIQLAKILGRIKTHLNKKVSDVGC